MKRLMNPSNIRLPKAILAIPLFLFLMTGFYYQMSENEISAGLDNLGDDNGLKYSGLKIKGIIGTSDSCCLFSLASNHEILIFTDHLFFKRSSIPPAIAFRAPPA
jgi:hypothetical protein